jgi:tetratricopeptide (TPR) repeat protein
MSDSLRDSYLQLIDKIVDITLQGKIRSKTQVYRYLAREIQLGTGEIFERCLGERIVATEAQLDKKLKASRILRALQTVEQEWERYQQENQASNALSDAAKQILETDPTDRLVTLLRYIDPNQKQVLTPEQLQTLAQTLQQQQDEDVQALGQGIVNGLQGFKSIEGDLIGWIYERQSSLGFGGSSPQASPWEFWAKKINRPFPKELFTVLSQQDSISELASKTLYADIASWVELGIILQYIQRGLVIWFDKQPYDSQVGKRLSTSTFLTFANIWNQLSMGFQNRRAALAQGSFQMTLQILRTFAQREDFPLYGGIFASFSGEYLRNTLQYLDEPLGRFEATSEKARILTLLGYSQRTLGQYVQAQRFHQEALEIARSTKDQACEVANLNHLSRLCVVQQNYSESINHSQRALILARQSGDKLGEANALVNLGYGEVFSAQEGGGEIETYERAINYLEQGLALSEKLHDRQSQSLCYYSLGLAYVVTKKPSEAIPYLEKGLQAALYSGDLYLQGLNLTYLADALYAKSQVENAIYTGCLGMYLLHQIGATEWRKPAGLMTIVQGQVGAEGFNEALGKYRRQIIAMIGVDGYDYIPKLLLEYRG